MRISLVIILFSAAALSGCNGASNNANSNTNSNANANTAQNFKPPEPIRPLEAADPNFKACNPYFPLVPGSVAKYVVTYPTGLVADATVIVDSGEDSGRKIFTQRTQLVDRSGGMEIAQTIVKKFACDGNRIQVLSEKTESNVSGQQSSVDFEFRENSLMMTDAQSMTRKGSTWSHTFAIVTRGAGQPETRSDAPTTVIFEVLGPEEVTVAVGTFKAVKVNRKIGEGYTYDYYVPGLGLAKRQSKEGVVWELKEYSGLKAMD